MGTAVKPPADGLEHGRETDRVATILRDIECPDCMYNLRGLLGPIVQCPDCGHACNVPKMIATRWTRPWWSAPGFNTVLLPTAWLLLSMCGIFVSIPVALHADVPLGLFTMLVALIGLTGWVFLVWRAWQVFDGPEGAALAMLGHVIMVGLIVGIPGTAVGLVSCLFMAAQFINDPNLSDLISALLGLVGGLVSLGIVIVSRVGERFIAHRCIARHLRKLGAQ